MTCAEKEDIRHVFNEFGQFFIEVLAMTSSHLSCLSFGQDVSENI